MDTFKFQISSKQKHSNSVHTICCLTIWVQTFPGHLSGLPPPQPHTDPERAPRDWERYDGSPRHYPGTHTASQPQLFNDRWTGSYIVPCLGKGPSRGTQLKILYLITLQIQQTLCKNVQFIIGQRHPAFSA